jgi:hypothetical protein
VFVQAPTLVRLYCCQAAPQDTNILQKIWDCGRYKYLCLYAFSSVENIALGSGVDGGVEKIF